jgi:GH25 family lysozyme M1 (1,4-beta-N-acetylmuramidase)
MGFGIDIHPYYQRHVTSWPAVRDQAGVDWIYVKVSDGTRAYTTTADGVTYRPDTHVNGARSVGIPAGGYHYAQFGDPVAQAALLVREVRRLGCSLPPMLDLEAPFTPNVDAGNFGIAFCRAVADAGFRPAVYMSASFAKVLRPDQWNIPGLVIWVAAYGTNLSRLPYTPGSELVKVRAYYGGRLDVHQFGSTGRIPGISDQVDVNESFTELGGTDMDQAQNDALVDVGWRTWAIQNGRTEIPKGQEATDLGIPQRLWDQPVHIVRAIVEIKDKLAKLGTAGVDTAALAASLGPAVAKSVNDEIARRQAE